MPRGEAVVLRYLAKPEGDGWRVGLGADPDRLVETMALGDGTDRRALTFGTSGLAPGGSAFCLTLRLDHQSAQAQEALRQVS